MELDNSSTGIGGSRSVLQDWSRTKQTPYYLPSGGSITFMVSTNLYKQEEPAVKACTRDVLV